MKRSASNEMLSVEDDGNGTKRRRSSGRTVDARFLLQSKNAGAIIGKGGANINRLRKDFKASVTVPDCPGPERILTIVADIETVGDILTDIIPKLEDYAHHRTTSFECEMRMLMHQSHAGCVIGRGGQRIKELREKTGAQIKVYSNVCPESTERVAQITGFPNVVVDCVKEICDLINQSPIKGPSQLYDPHNYSMIYAHEYGGFGEGGGRGRGGPGAGGNPNRPPRPPMGGGGGGGGPSMFSGGGFVRGGGSMGRQDHPPPFSSQSMGQGGSMGGDGPPMWRGPENNNYGMPPPPPPPGGLQRAASGMGGGPNRGPPLMGGLNAGGPNMVRNGSGGGGGPMFSRGGHERVEQATRGHEARWAGPDSYPQRGGGRLSLIHI